MQHSFEPGVMPRSQNQPHRIDFFHDFNNMNFVNHLFLEIKKIVQFMIQATRYSTPYTVIGTQMAEAIYVYELTWTSLFRYANSSIG